MLIWLLAMMKESTFGGAIHGLVLAAILMWFSSFFCERKNSTEGPRSPGQYETAVNNSDQEGRTGCYSEARG